MELAAGLWMGVLAGLLGLLFVGPYEVLADVSSPLSSTDHNYFSEGGDLVSNLGSIFKRKVTPRKKAESSSLSENFTLGVEDSHDLKPNLTKISNDPLTLQSSRNPPDQYLQHNSTLKNSEHQVANVSSIGVHKPVLNVSSTPTVKIATGKDEPATTFSNRSITSVQKKKSKPGLTFDVDDLPRDANGKVLVTKENLVGAGPSFDYVVPIVIAMLAVPFVAVFGAFLYKKSRDFWDRRHYRRMDFLIDGMYND